jgi:hypothetical protein
MTPYFSDYFKGQLKTLMKKYPQIKEDLLDELDELKLENEITIGNNIYKIRIKSSDMKKGKSGGFRSYLYCYRKKDLLVPLCMYPKSERETLSDNELQWHLDRTMEELIRKI